MSGFFRFPPVGKEKITYWLAFKYEVLGNVNGSFLLLKNPDRRNRIL